MMIQSKTNNHLSIINNHCALGTTSTTVVSALQIAHFMQNKPNFQKAQMNVNKVITKDYEDKTLGERGKNKPNSKPIQTQTNPIKANKMPKQTQFKPKQTQSKPISPPPRTEQLVRKYPIFAVKSLLKIAEKGCSAYKNAIKAVKQKQNSIY